MSDFFDSVGDFASDIGGGIADAATTAFDFLTPSTDRRGASFSVSDLMNGLGDAVENTALGGLASLPNLLTSNKDLGEKLLWGGLMVGGAYMGARQLAGARHMRAMEMPDSNVFAPARAIPDPKYQALGLPAPQATETAMGGLTRQIHPGLKARTVDIMSAGSDLEAAQMLTGHTDKVQLGHAAGFIGTYGSRLRDVPPEGQLAAAQLDFAKVDLAMSSGIIQAGRSGEMVNLWKQFIDDPYTLSRDPEKSEKLLRYIEQVGTATRGVVEPDMTVDPVIKIARIDVSDAGTVVHFKAPLDWDLAGALDPKIRSKRIKQLNLRSLAPMGKEHMKALYREAMESPESKARLLDRGEDWYKTENGTLAKTLDGLHVKGEMQWVDMDRLAAAVSLTSEATDWDKNVELAVNVLRHVEKDPALQEPGFQQWLADPALVPPLDAARHEVTFARAWDVLKESGDKLKEEEARKVFRLFSQDGVTVFGKTGGPKQKNFYLNLLDPTDRNPVTIDRHMIDIFFGVATHSDFKVLETRDLGDGAYEILSDTLRQAAKELSEELNIEVMPHQVQGVIWQAWRSKKKAYGYLSHDWNSVRGPFRLKQPNGEENLVYDLLRGRPTSSSVDLYSAIPDGVVYASGVDGEGLDLNPDGSLRLAAHATRENAQTLRTAAPRVQLPSGVALWGRGERTYVQAVDDLVTRINREVPGAEVEVLPSRVQHPVELAGPHLEIELPAGARLDRDDAARIIDPRVRVVTHGTADSPRMEQVHPDDLNGGTFTSDTSPLHTHQWAAISAAVGDWQVERHGLQNVDNAARHAELGARLRAAGYNPLEQQGVYDGGSEPSWLVFGITPAEAVRFGDMFQQDSVITNDRLYYGKSPEDLSARGMSRRVDPDGMVFNPGENADFRSVTQLPDGTSAEWVAAIDWDAPLERADPKRPVSWRRTQGQAKRVFLPLAQKDLDDMEGTLARLQLNGAKVRKVYSPGAAPAGMKTVREHVYDDGVSMAIVRTADNEIAAPNGYHVHVPAAEADRLAAKNPHGARARKGLIEPTQKVPDGPYNFDGLAVADTPDVLTKRSGVFTVDAQPGALPSFIEGEGPGVVVSRSGGRFNVTAPEGDVTPAVRAIDALMRVGVDPEKINLAVGDEAAKLDYVPPAATRGHFTTTWNADVPGLRRSGAPDPTMAEKYGYEVYTRGRVDGKNVDLHPDVVAGMAPVQDAIAADPDLSRMLRLVNFSQVGPADWKELDGFDGTELAWAGEEAGSTTIGLNPTFWDPVALEKEMTDGKASNWYNPNVQLGHPASDLLAHEFGHVFHYAWRASFPSKGAADEAEKALRKMYKALNKKGRGAATSKLEAGVSTYAGSTFLEFMAETLSEAAFSPSPRPIALEVYNTVMDQFRRNVELIPESNTWARGRSVGAARSSYTTLYRGLSVPPDQVDMEKLGTHWTTDKSVAEEFATFDEEGNYGDGTVLTANVHKRHFTDWRNSKDAFDSTHREREQPLKPGAIVHLDNVEHLSGQSGELTPTETRRRATRA